MTKLISRLYISAIILNIFSCSYIYAQKPPVKYGKLDSLEINLKEYKGADAVILCDYGYYEINGKLGRVYFYFTRHLRIKILSDKGLAYANHSIPFYDLKQAIYGFKSSQVAEIKAQTITPDKNGKPRNIKLRSKSINISETDHDFNANLTFTFPDVKVGSVIEYRISTPTIFMADLPPWYFQYDIPVLHSELRVRIPDDMNYEAKHYNLEQLDLIENKPVTGTAKMQYGIAQYSAYQLRFVKKNINSLPLDKDEWKYNQNRMQIKLMLSSASRTFLIPRMDEIILAMDPEYRYLTKSEKSFMTNSGHIIYYNPTLKELPERMLKRQTFGQPLNLDMGQTDTITVIKENTENKVQLMEQVYELVRNNMKWNGKFRVFVNVAASVGFTRFLEFFSIRNNINKSLSRPLKKETGTSSEINFILINLLRKAGLKADPVLVSTRDNNNLDPEFFNLHQFNHVIARVEIDNRAYFLDAVITDAGSILETVQLNPMGLLIKMDEAEWINLVSADHSKI